jgi:hypothetical protein
MTYTVHKNRIQRIRLGDPNFMIQDGLTITPRAGFEISQKCPEKYKDLILECINHGWLKSVAHVPERELIFSGLTK